ncbi:hypothetical protein [Nitrobacter sp.]|uniref:hypothetical protein n=1 Tax=Nitrobacter sp. TaxID=29420 RepID=UPI001D7242F7|nr:hypothetical protein [Nitrobacter sp.]MCB1393242.1 hypothetical protein [Nitrobacter sp.]
MLFLVPDETGRITQANKVYDPKGYDRRLDEAGVNYVKVNHPGVLSPDEWMVIDGAPTERPVMAIAINKVAIKAGDNDAAVLTGAPKDVAFSVSVQGSEVWSGTLPDGELELSVPTPGLYQITLTKWPYRDFAMTIEAVA